jgi:hypothetical protein
VPRRRIPPDFARLLEVYTELGRAARWGLFVQERVMRRQVREAAHRAAALERRLGQKP